MGVRVPLLVKAEFTHVTGVHSSGVQLVISIVRMPRVVFPWFVNQVGRLSMFRWLDGRFTCLGDMF